MKTARSAMIRSYFQDKVDARDLSETIHELKWLSDFDNKYTPCFLSLIT